MGRSVLCVDSDRNLCDVLSKALESEGWSVAAEYDGERALETIREDPPDLVLMDVILPGRDGFSVLQTLREGLAPALPVVLLSGCTPSREYQQRAEGLAAADLLTKPVPLDRLKQVVARQLGEPKRDMPARDARRRSPEQELSGRLERFSFAALLHHLHGLRATGVLHLESGRRRKWVQLRDGYPVSVRSNLVSECLGNFLSKRGRISSEAMSDSISQLGGGKLQGEILVAMEVLSEDDVSDALREQAEAKLFEIFGWTSGEFRFEFGARLQKASGLSHRSPANWILPGVCSRMPLERVDGWLKAQQGMLVARGRSPFYRFQEIALDPMQYRLVEEVAPGRPLTDYLGAEERVRRSLFALIRTAVLELRDPNDVVEADAKEDRSAAAAGATSAPPPAESVDDEVRRKELDGLRKELTEQAERFGDATPFVVLGVSEDAETEAVNAAYEALAARFHPDRLGADSDAVRQLASRVFAQVEKAFETVSDPRRRQEYLLGLKRAERDAAAQEDARRAAEAQRHFQEGEAALKQRAYEVALGCFGKALQHAPQEGEYHAHYGWALHLCNPDDATMAEEALEHLKRGLKLASDREKPYLLMGRLCKAMGRAGAAEKMFTRAAQIQPNCVEALRELRLINMRREKKKGLIGRFLRR
jgi:CheY-like chemotaxis protein/curved DNA-binding protein CbpA